ncbi:MAG TPA: hypothetical protein DCZ75_07390 [Geobacter sp.]|nr:hypothetical protein [Geobacter sp.]
MTVPSFDTSSLKKLSDGDLIQQTFSFAERIKNHDAFQNLQEHVPGYDRFTNLGVALQKTSEAARYGDRLLEAEKERIREEIIRCFIFACQHAVMVATHRNAPSMLEIGIEQKQRAYSRSVTHSLPAMPQKLILKKGNRPGMVVATVGKESGVGSIELQFTDNPGDESSWKSLERYYNCRMEVSGLDSVKRYYFRVRYHNSVGSGPWSAVVSIVVE